MVERTSSVPARAFLGAVATSQVLCKDACPRSRHARLQGVGCRGCAEAQAESNCRLFVPRKRAAGSSTPNSCRRRGRRACKDHRGSCCSSVRQPTRAPPGRPRAAQGQQRHAPRRRQPQPPACRLCAHIHKQHTALPSPAASGTKSPKQPLHGSQFCPRPPRSFLPVPAPPTL